MYTYGNSLGEHTDQNVIKTYVGFSTQDERDIYDKIYPKIFREAYNNIVQQYVDAGYNPTRGQTKKVGADAMYDLMVKNIPVVGTIINMIGGMFGFGKPKAPEVPYLEIRNMAKQIAKRESTKLVSDQKKSIIAQMKESEQVQRWDAIQQSREQSSLIAAPTNVTIKKGRMITRVKGDTTITPSL